MAKTATSPKRFRLSLPATIRAFEEGLTTSLPIETAVKMVDGWARQIEKAERPELLGIAQGLRQLSGLLTAGPLDGKAIGAVMQQVGGHTAQAAGSTGDARLEAKLRTLGGYVKAAGVALAGGTRPDAIAGVSTKVGLTTGDPTLRTTSNAPDLTPRRG